jgi:hypothetical protein
LSAARKSRLTEGQARTVARAREILTDKGDQDQDFVDRLASRVGSLEWYTGELLVLVGDLTGGAPGTATLTAEQLATVLNALADAADYRRACADQYCTDCEVMREATGQACGQHLDDLDAASEYDDLAAVLEPGGPDGDIHDDGTGSDAR